MDNTSHIPNQAFKQTAPGSMARSAADAAPEPSNGGGTAIARTAFAEVAEPDTPRLVIRGESTTEDGLHSTTPSNKLAFIDWLNFTFICTPIKDLTDFEVLDETFRSAFGFGITRKRRGGFLNYDESYDLGESEGKFGIGGSSTGGTAMVSLPGKACMEVKNWTRVHQLLQSLVGTITRIDLTHDDFQGIYNIQTAMHFVAIDGFRKNGRSPLPFLHDDLGSNKGKTLEIGSRESGKMLRVYEKGKKEGDPTSPWVRWELELHNEGRRIPHETIINPGKYLAGSYPCMNWINLEQSRIGTVTATAKIKFEQQVRHCRNSYGKLIWMMRHVLDYDAEAIIEALSVEGMPKRISNLPIVANNGDTA